MTAIVQLVSVCVDKLHLSNLVDAYAELIRAEAFKVEVNVFDLHICIGALVILGLYAIYEITRKL